MSRPRVLWLTRYDRGGASSRYRAFQYLDHELLGSFEHHVIPLAEYRAPKAAQVAGVARRLRAFSGLSFDLVVVQKEPVMPSALWRLLAVIRDRRTPIVWDVDDAIWIGGAQAEKAAAWMAGRADVVVAGNDLIARWMEQHGASRTTVVPTTFDPPDRPSRRSTSSDSIRLVWIGSPATSPLLDQYSRVLAEVFERSPALELELVGSGQCSTANFGNVTVTPWTAENEQRALSAADYGLALQRPDAYNDHKCGFKLIQYMAYGVVPIASSGVVHQSIVGNAGVVLPSDDAHAVDELVSTVRSRPSAALRNIAKDRWSKCFTVDSGARRWADILADAIADGGGDSRTG